MDERDWPGRRLRLAAQFTWDLTRRFARAAANRGAAQMPRDVARTGASKGGTEYRAPLHREGA